MTTPPTEPVAAPDALPRPVVALGWVSFAQDLASEMVTPILPLLLLGPLGASAVVVGLIEGVAEAVSQALRPWVGRWSDGHGRHRELTVGGYALSTLGRPLIGLAGGWGLVLGLRVLDRVGKGLRTAPRDALLAEATPAASRAAAFGFHRSMDHLGAALGPLLAMALLVAGADLATVVLASAIPGLATVWLVWRAPLPTIQRAPAAALERPPLDPRGRRLVAAATLLAFANLPEAFLVVWAHQAGWSTLEIAALWAVAHLLKTAVAWPAGRLADRGTRERLVLVGWGGRAAVLLLGMQVGAAPTTAALLAVFLGYAATLAVSEGAERALIAAAAPAGRRGAAFGWYSALPGLAALPGALLVGALWDARGAATAFGVAAALAAAAALALALRPGPERAAPHGA